MKNSAIKKISRATKAIALLLGMSASAVASANLIVNGSFEDNDVAAGTWQYFSAGAVNGWDGSNIEIWDSMNGVTAADGRQHAELNAHPYTGSEFSIYQTFATVVGQVYDVSFFYRARASDNEAFRFTVGSIDTLINDHVTTKWNQYVNAFTATATTTTLRFTSVVPSADTVGNFLDGVVVNQRVPEPAGYALLALGLVGLGMARRRTSH